MLESDLRQRAEILYRTLEVLKIPHFTASADVELKKADSCVLPVVSRLATREPPRAV